MPPDAYVAPARYPLTVLHRQDPLEGGGSDPATGESAAGWTVCGSPMLESELWQPVDRRDGDRLCGVCWYEPGKTAGDVQGALL